jgi:peptide/nickel transport system permease protein
MRKYITPRFLLFLPTLLLAPLLIFLAMRVIPGDVATVILAEEESSGLIGRDQFQKLREKMGLNDPLYVQYGKWMWSMVNGSFGGESLITREPISEMVARRSRVTLQLAVYTIVLSLSMSIPIGVIAAVKQDRWSDYIARSFSILGTALPNFWVALMIILILVVVFQWSPPLRYKALWDEPFTHFQKIV